MDPICRRGKGRGTFTRIRSVHGTIGRVKEKQYRKQPLLCSCSCSFVELVSLARPSLKERGSGQTAIDRIGGAWLLTGVASFMILIFDVNRHSLSDSNLEYGQSQPYC